jgi:hypothetical protein
MKATKLTANFTLEELCFSITAQNNDLEDEQNSPPKEVVSNLTYLAEKVLEPIRAKFGRFSPTSAYRSPELNRLISPKSTRSFHLFGMAADINLGSREKNRKLFDFVRQNLQFTELINEYPDNNGCPQWVHVAIARGRESEKVVKKATKGKGIEIISRG